MPREGLGDSWQSRRYSAAPRMTSDTKSSFPDFSQKFAKPTGQTLTYENPLWKQARSASDKRLHRAVPLPVDGAHHSRSLTCIPTPDNDAHAALARCKCTVLYTYDALPPRVAGDLRGIHNRTRLRRRIDAGGPLAGPPSRPGAQTVPPCCSAEASAEQFLWYNGGFVNFAR